MAFDSPPAFMDSTTMDAQLFRRAIGSLINPAGGIVTPGDLTVTQQSTPNMSVSIGTGQIWVPGTSSAAQGPYYSRNGAAITQNINTASSSNPRIDTIGAQIIDQAYAGSGWTCTPLYVPGTPTAGLTTPPTTATQAATDGAGTVPASSYVIAYVLVPQSATSIVTADIANVAAQIQLTNAHGYEWNYSQITAPVNVTSTNESSPTTIISPPAFTPDGGPVIAEFFCPYLETPSGGLENALVATLMEGTNEIGRLAEAYNVNTSAQNPGSMYGRLRFTPSAAAHTYTVGAWAVDTSGTPLIGAGAGGSGNHPPAFVRFTKV